MKRLIIFLVMLLCTSALAQQKNLTCVLISVDDFPGMSGQEIHITLDEANSRAASDDYHDDGNFHPARFTPTKVTWNGGQVVFNTKDGRRVLFGPLMYDLSRTTGKMDVGTDNQLGHHFQCEASQQKF